MMKQLRKHKSVWPKTVDLDKETMISISKLIAYVMVGSTAHNNSPPDMQRPSIEKDAALVEKWIWEGTKDVNEISES